MGRKNHRIAEVPPDDLPSPELLLSEPITVTRQRWETDEERRERLHEEFKRDRMRTDRRTDRRVLEALVDWDTCCIPGCGQKVSWRARPPRYDPTPDPSKKIPVCEYHETIIGLQVQSFMADADRLRIRERLARRRVEEEIVRDQRADDYYENEGATQGQIYVIRQGGLIKVGWSSKLRSRLKHYGAGVEILAHYPATRAEETALHRSLRPFLARGREWYQDCKLLADVVEGIHKRHGAPTIFPTWTEPKPDQAARPKGFPAA